MTRIQQVLVTSGASVIPTRRSGYRSAPGPFAATLTSRAGQFCLPAPRRVLRQITAALLVILSASEGSSSGPRTCRGLIRFAQGAAGASICA